jgi:hypothetical protein
VIERWKGGQKTITIGYCSRTPQLLVKTIISFSPSGRLAWGCSGGSQNPNKSGDAIWSFRPLPAPMAAVVLGCRRRGQRRRARQALLRTEAVPHRGSSRGMQVRRRDLGGVRWSMAGRRWCGGARRGVEEADSDGSTSAARAGRDGKGPNRRGGGDKAWPGSIHASSGRPSLRDGRARYSAAYRYGRRRRRVGSIWATTGPIGLSL